MDDEGRQRIIDTLMQKIKQSHPEYAPMVPDHMPEDVILPVPKGQFQLYGDPAFGVSNDGHPVLLTPPSIDYADRDDQVKLGHELVHYMQFLNMQKDARKKALGDEIAHPEGVGPPAPPEIDGGVYRNKFLRFRRKLEKDAQKFETSFRGLTQNNTVRY